MNPGRIRIFCQLLVLLIFNPLLVFSSNIESENKDTLSVSQRASQNQNQLSIKLIEKAQYHLSVSEYAEALAELDKATSQSLTVKTNFDLSFTRASVYFLAFDFENALSSVTKAESLLDEMPSNLALSKAVVFTKSGLYYYTGRLRELESYLSKSFIEDDSDAEAHEYNDQLREHLNANLLWNNGQAGPSFEYFNHHISNDLLLHLSENTYYRFLGDLYNLRKEYGAALNFYHKIPNRNEDLITKGFTTYSRLIETNLKEGNISVANDFLQKLDAHNANSGNPFKNLYQRYLAELLDCYSDSGNDFQEAIKIIDFAEQNDLAFFKNYFAVHFAAAANKFGKNSVVLALINRIDADCEDRVTMQMVHELLVKLGKPTGIFKSQNLQITSLSPSEFNQYVDQIYPLNQPKGLPLWARYSFGLLFGVFALLVFFWNRNRTKLRKENENLGNEYQTLMNRFEQLSTSAKTSNEAHIKELLFNKSSAEDKLFELESQFKKKEKEILSIEAEKGAAQDMYEKAISEKNVNARKLEEIQNKLETRSQKLTEIQNDMFEIKEQWNQESLKSKQYERLLQEKDIELENARKNLEKQTNEKLIKLSSYKDQLTDIEQELKQLEKRTSGTLNTDINGLIAQLKFKTQYENYLDNFIAEVETRYPLFAAEIFNKHRLTEKQKIIAYSIKMKMNVADTAQLIGTGKEAVKKARNRLWKQLQFENLEALKQNFENFN